MTLESWVEESRRMTWYGAFDGVDLVGVMGLEKAGYQPSPDPEAVLRHYYDIPEDRLQSR